MKRYLSILLVVLTTGMFANLTEAIDPVQQIRLVGMLYEAYGVPTVSNSVSISINDPFLYVTYKGALGSLTVTVTDSQGYQVYQKTVNVSINMYQMINMQNWASGTYTICIADAYGGRLQGTFTR